MDRQTTNSETKDSSKGSGVNSDDKWTLEKELADSTTCHGLHFWCDSKYKVQRVFWVLFVVGMTCALIQQLVQRITAYGKFETSTEINRHFRDSIEFPAVTICNVNRFFFPQSDGELKAMLLLNKISPEEFQYIQAFNLTVNMTALDFFNQFPNQTLSGFMQDRGYPFENSSVLYTCRFKTTTCSAADFKPVLTNSGKCYTFNSDVNKDIYQIVGGHGNGLSLTLNALHWNYTEEPDSGRLEAGIKVQIHDKNEPPDPDKFGLAVPVGRKAYMSISRKDTTVMYKPWGQCDPRNEKKLFYFSNYTFDGCMQDCFTYLVIKHCGCHTFSQYWAKGFAPECTAHQMANCSSPLLNRIEKELSPSDCQCTTPCTFSEYPVTLSYTYLPNLNTALYFRDLFGQSTNYLEQNIVALDISFRDIAVTREIQSKKIDESALLSDMGGQLGLWIGMSCITLIEFIQYGFFRLCWCFTKALKGDKKRVEDARRTQILNVVSDERM